MEQPIGTCGNCGGTVYAFRGAWGGTVPPSPGRCHSCGAEAACGPVIPMQPPHRNDREYGYVDPSTSGRPDYPFR